MSPDALHLRAAPPATTMLCTLVAAVATGCAVTPPYEPPAVGSPAATLTVQPARSRAPWLRTWDESVSVYSGVNCGRPIGRFPQDHTALQQRILAGQRIHLHHTVSFENPTRTYQQNDVTWQTDRKGKQRPRFTTRTVTPVARCSLRVSFPALADVSYLMQIHFDGDRCRLALTRADSGRQPAGARLERKSPDCPRMP